jgi:hypothetical protein
MRTPPRREGKRGAPEGARGRAGRRDHAAGRGSRPGAGLRRCRPGGRGDGDPGRDAEGRGRHAEPRLVSLRAVQARPGAARRRARHGRRFPVPGPDRDERQGRSGSAIRRGSRHAGRTGRDTPDRQAHRARRRGQRRRARSAGPRAGGADRRPQARPAAAAAGPGHALRRDRRHRRPGDCQGDGGTRRQGRRRPRPHPRGQARRLQTPSSPCAAARPAATGKPPAALPTLRREPPDQPRPEDGPGCLQNCRAPLGNPAHADIEK